jgi:uncharacterized protein with LGFP repeats
MTTTADTTQRGQAAPAGSGMIARLAGLLERRISRRSFLVRAAVTGSAVTVGGLDFVLSPADAYATVCGPEASCASGWTAFCCSIHKGVNQCPSGSFAGGWWKAGGANMCGGNARYVVDCQAKCECGCDGGQHFCRQGCWNCDPHCAHDRCDQRRVCRNVFRYGQCEQDQPCSGAVLCRTVSCAPPWEWADCSRASATDQATVAHNATCLPEWNPLMRKYKAMGSQASLLGASVKSTAKLKKGKMQRFTGGRIYWSKKSGAHEVPDSVLARYEQLHETRGVLGFPTRDLVTPITGADLVHFQNGALYRFRSDPVLALTGAIYDVWIDNTGAKGPLGVPTASVSPTRPAGGTYALFANGSIFAGNGMSPRAMWGAVAAKYQALRYFSGKMGFPTSGMMALTSVDGAAVTVMKYQTGTIVQVSETGAFGVWGPINTAWLAAGGVAGPLGVPTSDVVDLSPATQQATFAHGVLTLDVASGGVTTTRT